MKMKMNKITRILLSSAAAAALYAPAITATTTSEVEVNDTMDAAQKLGRASSHSVSAVMGIADVDKHNDVDFYTFEASAGDVISLDIDGAYNAPGDVNTIIAIFNSNPLMLRMNIYAPDVDEGSTSTFDARIDNFTVPATGTYTVGVSSYPRVFTPDGRVVNLNPTLPTPLGDYTLNITGITMDVKQISFEVKPGRKEMSRLNPGAKGKVPVAIFGSADFDVSSINLKTLTFGSTGSENSLSKCQNVSRDINKDGYGDLLCHFNNEAAGFKSGDIEAKLKGETKAKQAFEGQSVLKVIPTNRK